MSILYYEKSLYPLSFQIYLIRVSDTIVASSAISKCGNITIQQTILHINYEKNILSNQQYLRFLGRIVLLKIQWDTLDTNKKKYSQIIKLLESQK